MILNFMEPNANQQLFKALVHNTKATPLYQSGRFTMADPGASHLWLNGVAFVAHNQRQEAMNDQNTPD
ncbi:6875_t:CDS:2 [Ambispora leptoticha]|uniref:6875_t:CDS:1 n=1 Tax=Ambispora leptoticha TaxID=144679 RepID=A0A9N9BW62_9GLOM|nr:6875_t:CDS:2 [Ambispora leptoticha]